MMFKKEMAELIFAGKKTQTRRLASKSSKNYKVGSIQPIQTSYHTKAVGHVKILKAFMQKLSDMTEADVHAEGFDNWANYMEYLDSVNRRHMMPDDVVKVYEFELYFPVHLLSEETA